MSYLLAQIADSVRRIEESQLQHYVFKVAEVGHHEVICFDREDDDTKLMPWLTLVVEVEEPEPNPDEIQVKSTTVLLGASQMYLETSYLPLKGSYDTTLGGIFL